MPFVLFLGGAGLLGFGLFTLISRMRRRPDITILEGDDHLLQIAIAVCEQAGKELSDEEMVLAVVQTLDEKGKYPPSAFSAFEERLLFQQVVTWIQKLRAEAGEGEDLCDHVSNDGDLPPLPPPNIFEQLLVTPEPTENAWYRIKFGDTLFGITGRAYNVKGFANRKERVRLANWINDSELNLPYRISTAGTQNESFFPDGMISFFPDWSSVETEAGRTQAGGDWALIFIPPKVQTATFGG